MTSAPSLVPWWILARRIGAGPAQLPGDRPARTSGPRRFRRRPRRTPGRLHVSPPGGGTSMRDRPLLAAAAATIAAAALFSIKAVIVKLMYRHGVDATAAIGLRMA